MKPFRLTPPPVKLVENDIEKACLDLLWRRGYYPVRLHSGRFKTPDDRWITIGEPGLPDYVVVKNDFFLETKAPGRKLSPAQVEKIFELEKVRHIDVATVDSVERLVEWLKKRAGISGA